MRWKLGLGCAVFALSLIAGCSNSSNNGGGGNLQALAFGAVYKGLVANATVNVYVLQANGTKGRMLATGNTDNQGNFNIPVLNYTGWVVLAVFGGIATDFLGNTSTIDPEFPLYGIANVVLGNPTFFSVSVLTTLLFFALQAEMLRGGMDLDIGIANAAALIGLTFGINALFYTLRPSDLTTPRAQLAIAAPDADNYGAIMNGFCELAINVLIAEAILAHLMGRDLMDGLLDGQLFGSDIRSPTGTLLPANIWNVLFPLAISNFIQSQFNQSGLTVNDITTIAVMQALAVALVTAPLILAMFPRYLDRNNDTTIDILTNDVDSTNARVMVGDQTIDSANVSDIPDGLRVVIAAALTPSIFATTNVVSVQVDNTVTGLGTKDVNGLKALDSTVAPTIDPNTISPRCVGTGGGARICIRGTNLSMASTVTIGGQTARIVTAEGTPDKLVVEAPPLAEGSHNLVVTNPGTSGATVFGAITAKVRDLNNDATDTGTGDWTTVNFGITPTSARFLWSDITINDANGGTASITQTQISTTQPTPSTTTVNANAFLGRWGEEEALLLDDGNGFNELSRRFHNDGVAIGRIADGISYRARRATNAVASEAEGRYYCAMWQVNYGENWRRYMSGFTVLGPDGSGAIILRCWETNLLTGEVTQDVIAIPIEWDLDATGELTYSVVGEPTAGQNLRFVMSDNYNTFAGGGELDGSLVLGYAQRTGERMSNADQIGQWAGARVSLETDATGPSVVERVGASVAYDYVGVEDFNACDLSILEESKRDSVNMDEVTDLRGSVGGVHIAGDGLQRNENGDLIGAVYDDGTFGGRVYGEFNDNLVSAGFQLRYPDYQTEGSAAGRFFAVFLGGASAGDGSSAEAREQRASVFDVDPTTPLEIGGIRWPVTSTVTEIETTKLSVQRTAGRSVSTGTSTEVDEPFGHVSIARRSFFVKNPSGREVVPFATGVLSPRGAELIGSDNGAGDQTRKFVGFKDNPSGGDPTGLFRTSKLRTAYNLSNGDRDAILVTADMNFQQMGVVSGTGSFVQYGENGSINTGVSTIIGSLAELPNGFYEYQNAGQTFHLAFNWDRTAHVGIGVDEDGTVEIMVGARETTVAPVVGNSASLSFGYGFSDFAPFPPVFFAFGGITWDCFSAPGQITYTGSLVQRDNASMMKQFFQAFNTSSRTVDSAGAQTYSTGGNDYTGGMGASGVGQVSRRDDANFTFGVRISMNF